MGTHFDLIIEPDAEANMIQMLASDTRIAAFSPSITVSASTIGYTNDLTWVHTYRIGGSWAWPMPSKVNMHFDILSPDRATCGRAARLVHGVIFTHIGDVVGIPGSGMRITNAIDINGISWLPDPAGLPRYIFAVQISVQPI